MAGYTSTIAFDCPPAGCGYESPGETEFNAMMSDQTPAHPRPTPSRPMTARTISTRVVPQLPPGSSQPSVLSLDMVMEEAKRAAPRRVGFRDRVALYQWTWFTMTMATGGVSNLLYSIPYRSNWLQGIGLFFYFLNLLLFSLSCVLITIRFRLQPGSFINSFTDQVESLFIPSFIVSIATILINTCEYGIGYAGPWLQRTLEVGFWLYTTVAILSSAFMYLILWSTQVFPIHTMTPVWVFPAYPLLLTAPYASNLIAQSNLQHYNISAMAIALSATVVQGTGFLISFMVIASFLYRLMTQKLPRDTQRPGIFISVGPSGFTVAGIVFLIPRRKRNVGPHLHLGVQANEILPERFLGTDRELAATIIKFIAVMIGLWLWGLSVWFFFVSVGSLFKYLRPERRLPFLMTWWSFVFPNTALVTATEQLGKVFDSTPLQIIGCILAGSIVLVWVMIFCTMIKAILGKELLYPKEAQR